jgi:hypothetical protein
MHGLNQDSSPELELVKTALDKLVDGAKLQVARTGKAEATHPTVFTQDSAMSAAVVTSVIGGGGYFEKRTGDFKKNMNVAKTAATPKTTIIAEFNKSLPIARTFLADQQQSAVAKAVRQETQSWVSSRDRNAFGVYAGGFATNTTIDGAFVFSATHTNQNGDTIDNLEAGALDDTTLNASIVNLRGQVNQSGVKVGYEPDFLLTSSLGHKNGMTVAKSVLRPGTGNNDMNYVSEMFPGMEVVYNQFLDDTSTTAYFIGAAGHGISRFEREAFHTDMVDWKVQAAANGINAYTYLMIAREEVDAIEYSGLVGSTGV